MFIKDIEKLTYDKAKEICLEEMKIKEHDCIFSDLGDSFGYSVLIFKNGKHIYYANDYELHHSKLIREKGRMGLRDFYITELNKKLFTDDELLEDVKSYNEYLKKDNFLRSYWIMRYDRLSAFVVSNEDRLNFDDKKELFPFYNPVCYCYVKNEDIVETSIKYLHHLEKAFNELKNNVDEFRKMIAYELSNHEACVTCSYDETLSSLGLKFEDLSNAQQRIVIQELKKEINRYDY